MKSKSLYIENAQNIESALKDATQDGFKPTLAFVFMSVGPDTVKVVQPFDQLGIRVFGSHSVGEFVEGHMGQGAIAVLLLDMDTTAFHFEHYELTAGGETETARQFSEVAHQRFANPVFMMVSSHLETIAEDLLAGIDSVMGPQAAVFGAMAGMDVQTHENAVFTNEGRMDRGVLVLMIDGDRIKVSGIATCGWRAVGAEKTITKSDGMWVQEIDGMPALDAIIKYSGIATKENLTEEIWITEFGTSLPMQLIRDQGATVMRPSLVYDLESSSFMCNGRVPQGSKVRMSLPPEDDVIDVVIDACRDMRDTIAPEADAIVYFSCAGRLMSLGPMMKREIDSVQKLWDVPLAGLFSTGEIARAAGGGLELNNITSCCVVLKEI